MRKLCSIYSIFVLTIVVLTPQAVLKVGCGGVAHMRKARKGLIARSIHYTSKSRQGNAALSIPHQMIPGVA